MIKVKGLTKSYQKKVLSEVDFELEYGKIYCLLGRNGVGKTTLMKIMAGMLEYDAGDIQVVDDENHSECFHYVTEPPVFLDYLSGFDNIKFVSQLHNLSLTDMQLKKFIQNQGLEQFADDLVVNYSQGMKHQLSLAIAFLINPYALLLDEPLVSLDPVNIVTMQKKLKEFATQGNIVFLSTHMLPIANKLADEILILKDGTVNIIPNDLSEEELEKLVLKKI
ncbi:ABC transporter ATP-binding protein [Alkalihalobacillus sp. CinArs1]|uniref:ABC transporter ATP-binding protein n=1 Tax=Alkalihalobacillus sp. CinArs1 TaxID=2995314 RepID=UPI0022DE76FA|nr:ABC transporter ATP-binding protein [Alkalihalobacillus sp. CinArs1]